MDALTIRIDENKLEDGSMVYEVMLSKDGSDISFPCVTENDAIELASKLSRAIEAHTNESVVLV